LPPIAAVRETASIVTAPRPYNLARWKRWRVAYRNANPLCRMCLERGYVAQTFAVDHIIPHKGDMSLFWNPDNLQPLCRDCHDRHKQRFERDGFDTCIDALGWPADPRHRANKFA
jgi:5-methylcytosine-specific restriction protein A